MMKRLVSSALCFALAAGSVTSAFGATTLKTVSMFGGVDSFTPAYSKLVKDIPASLGITVQDTSDLATEAWKAGVITDFATGNEPDVIFYFNGEPAKSILPKVVDVATIKAKYPTYAADVMASPLKIMAEKDGKTYAVPIVGFSEALFVNKDVFDRYKLALPTDWAKFETAVKTLAANKVIPIALPFATEPYYLYELLVLSAGGAKEHDVKPGADFSKVPASWVKALETYKTLGDMGAFGNMKAATVKRTETARNEFLMAKAGMIAEGSWFLGAVTAAKRSSSVVPMAMPVMEGGKGSGTEMIGGFSSGYYITKKAWDNAATQKAAVDFVTYMTSKNSIKAMATAGGSAAIAANVPMSINDPAKKALLAAGSNASGICMPLNDAGAFNAPAWAELYTNMYKVANGKTTASDLLKSAIELNK